MNNDAFLHSLPGEEFRDMVEATLRSYHSDINYIYSPLGSSSLVEKTLLHGEALTVDLQRIGISVLLRWGIDTLRQGSRKRQERSWRLYFSLWNPYIAGDTFEETANKLDIAPQSVYSLRGEALSQLAELLQQELAHQQDQKVRKELAIRQRFAERSEEEQQALQLLAVFDRPLPWQAAQELLERNGIVPLGLIEQLEQPLKRTLLDGLVQYHEENGTVEVHGEAQVHIVRTTAPQERIHWYKVAGEFFENQVNYRLAATYLQKARCYDEAIDLLWQHYPQITDDGEGLALQPLLDRFRQQQLDHDRWIKLKILAGRLAFELEHAESARQELLHVLGAENVVLRVRGYYYWAETLATVLFDAALQHYDKGIQLAEAHLPNPTLADALVDLYTGKAWLYIQERKNFDLALANLTMAQDLMQPNAHLQQCRLFNAWAQLHSRMGDGAQELAYRIKALEAATSAQYRREIMKTSHNLGQTYVFLKQEQAQNDAVTSAQTQSYIQTGIIYLRHALAWAATIGNRKWEDKCRQAIGAAYFLGADYEQAIVYYRAAYESFVASKHENWQGFVCHDLAEAYAKLGKQEEMRAYFAEARAIAKRGRFQDLTDLLDQLARFYPDIEITLNERQRKALEYIGQHGSITNREYCEIAEVSNRTANRDLGELIDHEILVLVGKGRGARYERIENNP